MGKEITGLGTAYLGLFTAVLIVLAVLVILCLIRAIIGPRIADRIVSVNMMGTMVIVIIAILTVMLKESYLADICIIYAMISFLAVIVLTKVYMGVYIEKKEVEGQKVQLQETGADEQRQGTEQSQGMEQRQESEQSQGMEQQQESKQSQVTEQRITSRQEQQADKTDNNTVNEGVGGIS